MTSQTLEANYVIAGAGTAGMVFADTLRGESDARMILVGDQPLVILLVDIEAVQDDVDLAVAGFVGDDLLDEGLEVGALLGLRGLPADDAGGHFKGGEQVNGAMALVGALESLDHLPATGLDIAASGLQSLDRGLLVNTQDHGLFRWVQVQSADIYCFGRKSPCPPERAVQAASRGGHAVPSRTSPACPTE